MSTFNLFVFLAVLAWGELVVLLQLALELNKLRYTSTFKKQTIDTLHATQNSVSFAMVMDQNLSVYTHQSKQLVTAVFRKTHCSYA